MEIGFEAQWDEANLNDCVDPPFEEVLKEVIKFVFVKFTLCWKSIFKVLQMQIRPHAKQEDPIHQTPNKFQNIYFF